jgi:hypothetical protein
MAVLRPMEVLAEEWLALRHQGIHTPSIAAWPTTACSAEMCMGTKADGYSYTMLYTDVVCTHTSPSTISNDNCLLSALPIARPCFRMLSFSRSGLLRSHVDKYCASNPSGPYRLATAVRFDVDQSSTCARGLHSVRWDTRPRPL